MYSGCFPTQLVSTNDPFFGLCMWKWTGFKPIGFFILQIRIVQEKKKKSRRELMVSLQTKSIPVGKHHG